MPARFASNHHSATPGALEALSLAGLTPPQLLARHFAGDWSDQDPTTRDENEAALIAGSRVLSEYRAGEARVWVLTEAVGDDGTRELTTLLLPEEY